MKKYHTIIIVSFMIMLFSFYKVDAIVNDFPLLGKIIYLDAGHGGKDPGAISNGILEKDINLIITKKLASELERNGAIVLLTREDDYDLSDPKANLRKRNDLAKRAKLINDSNCDLFLSIHLNAYSSEKWRGLQIFYDDGNSENKKIAEILSEQIKNDIKNVREIKNVNDYYMYSRVKRPGVLIEVGFITNPDDRYLLRQEDYQKTLVKSITKGVENYFFQ